MGRTRDNTIQRAETNAIYAMGAQEGGLVTLQRAEAYAIRKKGEREGDTPLVLDTSVVLLLENSSGETEMGKREIDERGDSTTKLLY